ncbi:alpha/beta hydrolase-fold protein [Xanthomarina spongicola]|uniref:Enterochelin esterase-like enzyme n=1 Tax=Xanthomarina spongicola TaxID=570520 RepID=A0A316DTY6_9FLAO|nr:alpha/beta hydrolase-fold protein [Xanthomarina spongicola]PWK20968.1 enterochelin esterase-like enzyme [Xanthomarina spongicola]
MRTYCIFFLLLIVTCSTKAQEFSSYEKPIETSLYSQALNDSVSLEITLPKELKNQTGKEYPIIYLLDRQLSNNYKYNLYAIDYLSTLQWMPNAIVIGITFSNKNRNSWTVPNASGGKADNLILFIENELNNELREKYPISNFNLLIGHSRTAIFSSYALSKSPEFFNGTIASSVSNFDFGDNEQHKQFELFLNKIVSSSHKYYYYFSVGEKSYGDLHESAVDTLNTYLNAKKLPKNLEWKYYKHKIAHDLTPGVTVGNALSEIFKDYGRRIELCFDLAKGSRNKVPWNDFLDLYSSLSSELGFKIQPSELFFNSIASEYYNDYDSIYGDNNLDFTLEILLKAIEEFPNDFEYNSWIGEIYITLKEIEKGEHYLNKAIELINNDKSVSELDRINYLKEIEALKTE